MAKKTKPTMWEEGKTILMPKALHKKWTSALRSGEYKQATDSLYDSGVGGFCCLGVLCSVAGESIDLLDGDSVPSPEFLLENGIRFRNSAEVTGECPFGVLVPDPTLIIESNGNEHTAAAVNDSGKASFKKIADLIDEVVQVY